MLNQPHPLTSPDPPMHSAMVPRAIEKNIRAALSIDAESLLLAVSSSSLVLCALFAAKVTTLMTAVRNPPLV